jgi:caa(3)-type oxidase subunit IV
MNAHANAEMSAAPAGTEHEHAHPGIGTYVKVGLFLFVLTAAEVAVYEIGYGGEAGIGAILHPVVVPVLLALSAVKFALVAMFYMHLKQDSRLFSSVFVFPLIIAAVIILALIALFAYHYAFQKLIH